MSYFEYKVVEAPSTGRRNQRKVDGLDKYASTISDIMTELGLEGWDFVGAEHLRERRRRFLVLIQTVERTLLVFRREVSASNSAADMPLRVEQPTARPTPMHLAPVTPRRVKRPDLVEAVAAGARRIEVRRDATGTNPDERRGQVAAE